MSVIADNLKRVLERIGAAAERAGRRPDDIQLIVSTKGRSVAEIEEAMRAGATVIGENRVQEAREKYDRLGGKVSMHMIGHLQRNKVREALRIFSMIHSVNSLRLVEALEREAARAEKVVPILIEVNVSGESTKYGLSPAELKTVVEQIADMSYIQVEGLMTMTPITDNPEGVRPLFRQVREIAELIGRAAMPGVRMRHLSMGMSHDFEAAVEEGATMVRIGTAIFGR
jgi:pyridoxal phosphate enzyme (YggS family)